MTPRDKAKLFLIALRPTFWRWGWSQPSSRSLDRVAIRHQDHEQYLVYLRQNGLDFLTLCELLAIQPRTWPARWSWQQPNVIFDLGANIGIMSLFLASQFPSARLRGFEPLPSNYRICRRNYRNLKEARVFPWAIGSSNGTVGFEFNPADIRGGHIAGSADEQTDNTFQTVQVPVYTLDDLIANDTLECPDLLKIDVEGAEYDVLQGVQNHIDRVQTIYLETHGPIVEKQCHDWITARGLELVWERHGQPGISIMLYTRSKPASP